MEQYPVPPTHDLVWVSGPDAVTFLDDLLSQAIAPMERGEVRRSFLLAPNGKVRALLWVVRDDNRVGLVADLGFGDPVIDDLTRFKLRVDVELADPVPLFSVIDAGTGDGGAIAAPLGSHRRTLVTTTDGAAAKSELDGLRIEAGEPVMGIDIDESTIPQETGLVAHAVDFAKGCYLGQELVARIDSRGHVNKRLAKVQVHDDIAGPPPGAVVSGSAGVAGILTTTAPGVGMGLLRREAKAGDTVELAWEDGGAKGELIEFASV